MEDDDNADELGESGGIQTTSKKAWRYESQTTTKKATHFGTREAK